MLRDAQIWKSILRESQLTLIAGPCVIENERLCLQVAASMKKICARLGVNYIFKASF